MNNKQQTILSESQLDTLLITLREKNNAQFKDDNFTKMVLNQLPATVKRKQAHNYFPDSIGFIAGLLVMIWLIEPVAIWSKLTTWIQTDIVTLLASTSSLAAAIGMAVSLLSFVAWWVVEKQQ